MPSPLDSLKSLVEANDGEGAIDLILKWMREESSKVARKRLDQFLNGSPSKLLGAYSAWQSAKKHNNAPVMVEWALSIPFFSISVMDAVFSAKRKHSRMSGDVTKTASQMLKKAYGYNVRFRQWKSLHGDIRDAEIQQENTEYLSYIVMKLIEGSYERETCEGEIQELTAYALLISDLLSTFGFKLRVNTPPADDFIFSYMSNNENFLFGEGKQISSLPNKTLPLGTSHELCLFGFATYVAKCTPDPDVSKKLTILLGIKAPEKTQGKSDCRASEMAKSLLEQGEGIPEVAESIKNKLDVGEVQPDDAVNLWAAVMQACHRSISKGKQASIVMSAHMMWFIRLVIHPDDDGCYIAVSDGTSVGSGGSNEELIYFLAYARSLENMNVDSQRLWQKALQQPDESDQEGDTKGNSNTNTSHSHGDRDESGPKRRGVKGSTNTHSTQASSSLQVTPSIMKPTEDFEDLNVKQGSIALAIPTDEADLAVSFQGKDKYGVIPYFDQIGEPLEVLGHGRCGTVSKIKWGKGYAALKEFVIQPEDDRYFYDVYEYELKVLDNLRSLWGKYVPALLFHKPWATSPVIGLQLGEPIEEDYIEDWPKEDQVKVEETIAKVKALGWEQEDHRGTNFVRLVDQDGIERIAMIDFESLVPVVE